MWIFVNILKNLNQLFQYSVSILFWEEAECKKAVSPRLLLSPHICLILRDSFYNRYIPGLLVLISFPCKFVCVMIYTHLPSYLDSEENLSSHKKPFLFWKKASTVSNTISFFTLCSEPSLMPSSCLEESYQFPCTYDDPRQRSQQLNGFSTEEVFLLEQFKELVSGLFLMSTG